MGVMDHKNKSHVHVILELFSYLSQRNAVEPQYWFSSKEITFVALTAWSTTPNISKASHMSICYQYTIWEMNIGWEQTSWLVILKRQVRLHVLTPCPLFLHALLYNETITRHRRETGLSCSHSYQNGLRRSEAPQGSISKQHYRVPVAIRSGAHAKFSTLYVDWAGAKAEGKGYILTVEPSELHYSLFNSAGNVCKFDLRACNRNTNCCAHTWGNSKRRLLATAPTGYLLQSLPVFLPSPLMVWSPLTPL